jgi:dTDP-4-dehydrorhamnose reductase
MKVFVAGASGLVGRDLLDLFEKESISWIGSYNTHPFPKGVKVNFLDQSELQSIFQEHGITHCINAIAERAVDVCEKNWPLAYQTNVQIASNLARVCSHLGIQFIHISTDYVFDGTKSPYSKDSLPNPLQVYGITKHVAELRVQAACPTAQIIRVPVLYTHSYTNLLETAVTMIGKKVLDMTTTHQEDAYCTRRPVFIPDLCRFLVERLQTPESGVHHFYNAIDRETKYSMAQKIADFLGKSSTHIVPNATPAPESAGRPYDTQLYTADDKAFVYTTPIASGIQKCFQKLYHPPIQLDRPLSAPTFWMLDLDGTLLDTERLQIQAYNDALKEHNLPLRLTSAEDIETTLVSMYDRETYLAIRQTKNRILRESSLPIEFLPGADILLEYFLRHSVNVCIVTNTSRDNVAFFQSKLPLLAQCTQWIAREDVEHPKPNPEPYRVAKERFWKGESYIVGVENTVQGYMSLRHTTDCIYMVCSHKSHVHTNLAQKDVYFISDLSDLYTKVAK